MLPLSFLHPALLFSLIALPLIYLILRVIPPAAKRVQLPSLRLLQGLEQKDPPTHKIPWWILLLRLLLLALLIIGLAHPVLNPEQPAETGSGPMILVIDTGWASAQTWEEQQAQALRLATQAGRENRTVRIIATAPESGQSAVQPLPATSADEGIARIKALRPQSWPGQPGLAAKALEGSTANSSIYWISAGLAEDGYADLAKLGNQLRVYIPPAANLPVILREPATDRPSSLGRIEAVTGMSTQIFQLRASDSKGRLIDQASAKVSGGQGYIDADSSLPVAELDGIARSQIVGRQGAGAVHLRPGLSANDRIAMISGETEAKNYGLTDPAYYISRAIEPFAKFSSGPLETILKDEPGIIVIAESGTLPPATLEQLESWIKSGGIVLRFASTALSQTPDTLTPVPLRPYERSLQGNLTWDNPLTIEAFSAASPFAGMKLPGDVKIRRQFLAEPLPDLDERSWVTLSDKTPLITARAMDKGLLVLVHTTATPDWSDLPLSGFYVEIFKKLMTLAGRENKQSGEAATLHPLLILDGSGQLVQPPSSLKPIEVAQFAATTPSAQHPPGLYGTPEDSLPLNLGDRLPPLEPLRDKIPQEQIISESGAQEIHLAAPFLTAALLLLLLDMLIALILSGLRPRVSTAAILLTLLVPISPAQANDAETASEFHLAYIRTGDPAIDHMSELGLEQLSEALRNRTAVEPAKVMALTPGEDDLAFYPLIYWPVTQTQADLTPAAAAALQAYLDHGGMILLDSRDGIYQSGQIATSAQIERLRKLLGSISVNPMAPAPDTHVLFKSFYLLSFFPDISASGDIWIEDDALEENVSSVILSGRDWARAWSGTTPGNDQEAALRFGINAVMYAMTGNYKTDQIHMTTILKRLGQ